MLAAFEQAYRRAEPLFGSQPDTMFARMIVKKGLNGRALDVGSGDGRNSVFLAKQGFRVEALDASPSAASRLRRTARRARLDIRPTVCDVRDTGAISGLYDVIAADTILCHLGLDELLDVAARITSALKPGAWLYVSVFGHDDPGHSEFSPLVRTYFDPPSLLALFPGLRPETCSEQFVLDRRHGEPHHHALICLTAEKRSCDA